MLIAQYVKKIMFLRERMAIHIVGNTFDVMTSSHSALKSTPSRTVSCILLDTDSETELKTFEDMAYKLIAEMKK